MKKIALTLFAACAFLAQAHAQTTVTGPAASTIGHPATFNNTLGSVITDTPVLGVPVGGTGQQTLTAHGVVIGEGTSGIAVAPSGTAGAILVDQGAGNDPVFRTLSGAVTVNAAGFTTLSGGAVTSIATSTGLTGGPITSTGTLALDPSYMRGYLAGATLSGGGSQILTISAGVATSDDTTALMKLASTYTKTFSAWSVGSGNGGLDTGSIATSTWYHVYIIERTDTGVVDVLISTSASSPSMPTNYTVKRRIGSVKTDGTPNIISFFQNGDTFLWGTIPTADFNTTVPTSAASLTVSVPTGVRVEGIFNLDAAVVSAQLGWLLSSLDVSDVAPTLANSTFACGTGTSTGVDCGAQARVWTNTSAQIRHRGTVGVAATLQTIGWVDSRGRLN